MKELDKYDARKINACYLPLLKGSFGCYADDRHMFVSANFTTTLTWFVCMSLALSMRLADEKLIGSPLRIKLF